MNTNCFNVLYDRIRSKHKLGLLYTEVLRLSQGKELVWLRADLAAFFHENTIFTSVNSEQSMIIQVWVSGKHVLKNKQREPVTSRKTIDNICCQWQNLSFQGKIQILENSISITISFTASNLTDFFDEINGDTEKCDIFYTI